MGKAKKKRVRRNVTYGVAHINATFNNTTVTITDTKGETLRWASAGTCGFKGSRKSTPFAGQMAAQQAAEKAVKFGVKEVDVRVKGPGMVAKVRSLLCSLPVLTSSRSKIARRSLTTDAGQEKSVAFN